MMDVADIRRTTANKLAGSIRFFLAVLFLMTGFMKLLVPSLAEAFSGQLLAAQLPFYSLTRWTVPVVEVGLGLVLALGIFARPTALVAIGMMLVATYVHLVIDDPSLFPLQPTEPIIPLMVIALASYILWRGAGAWSSDLRATEGSSNR